MKKAIKKTKKIEIPEQRAKRPTLLITIAILAIAVFGTIFVVIIVQNFQKTLQDQKQYICPNGELVKAPNDCPILNESDISISLNWDIEKSCSEYKGFDQKAKILNEINISEEINRDFHFMCQQKVDGELESYYGGEPIERSDYGRGLWNYQMSGKQNIYTDHIIELCCYLAKYNFQNNQYTQLTDEKCIASTIEKKCEKPERTLIYRELNKTLISSTRAVVLRQVMNLEGDSFHENYYGGGPIEINVDASLPVNIKILGGEQCMLDEYSVNLFEKTITKDRVIWRPEQPPTTFICVQVENTEFSSMGEVEYDLELYELAE